MNTLFDINHIAFKALDYPVSYVELIGTLFGLISVYLASRAHIATWATGVVNEFFLFLLFFQVQLYADMLLQVFFLVVTLYGWYNWKRTSQQHSISTLSVKTIVWLAAFAIIGTMTAGWIFSRIHILFPRYFLRPAAYPFADSFVTILSMVATYLLALKKIENWVVWMTVNAVSILLFFQKGIIFLGLEYIIFFALAVHGLQNWKKQKSYD